MTLSHRESERLLSGIQRGPELGVEVAVLAVAGTVDRHLLAHLGLDAAALLHECFRETHLAGIAAAGGFPEGREQGSVHVQCSGSQLTKIAREREQARGGTDRKVLP